MQTATDPALLECAAQLLEVTPLVMRAIRAHMRAEGARELSVPQFRSLSYIGRHPHTSLSQVADHIGLTLAAASRLVDGLVGHHFVVRQTAEQDRRYVELVLSPEGVVLWQTARQAAQTALAERLALLPPEALAEITAAQEHLRQLFAASPDVAIGSGPDAHFAPEEPS